MNIGKPVRVREVELAPEDAPAPYVPEEVPEEVPA